MHRRSRIAPTPLARLLAAFLVSQSLDRLGRLDLGDVPLELVLPHARSPRARILRPVRFASGHPFRLCGSGEGLRDIGPEDAHAEHWVGMFGVGGLRKLPHIAVVIPGACPLGPAAPSVRIIRTVLRPAHTPIVLTPQST